ncbi:ABC transporter ATP-binding protein [Hoeflea sp. WL0058]|uniref:ABC transporter ATP-binding protein n=1 Tax=Flavimaribacter sediminis TaxID=2865987 RepID=A0AAE2ZM17_9HYPH|nr:ABC transporter ATP-binding protein [Flavimaribacter sediminis]MBW8638726.1 ABC transporter ATP-binding protein [Flavimaribacter sediminis]
MRLVAEQLTVNFGGLLAIADVDIDIGPGEIVGLIGANGAGKSTLVNVLSGFQKTRTGSVKLGDSVLLGLSPDRIARAGVVRTFQSVRLFSGISVRDNVAAAAAVLGSRSESVDTLLQLLDLADRPDSDAGSLPYAHQRRLAIARALALKPKFLLLDEPAAGMSPNEIEDLDRTLVALRDRTGMGLLLIEHNINLVMSICERLVVLDGGRVIARGDPDAIKSNTAVKDAYLGAEGGGH